jgi:hypothetical protein
MATSMKGSNTSMKTSISDSKTIMWHLKLWQALTILLQGEKWLDTIFDT